MSVKLQFRSKGKGPLRAQVRAYFVAVHGCLNTNATCVCPTQWINYDSTECKSSTVLELVKTQLKAAKEVVNLPAQEVISNMQLSVLPWHTPDLAWYVKTTQSPDDKPAGTCNALCMQ